MGEDGNYVLFRTYTNSNSTHPGHVGYVPSRAVEEGIVTDEDAITEGILSDPSVRLNELGDWECPSFSFPKMVDEWMPVAGMVQHNERPVGKWEGNNRERMLRYVVINMPPNVPYRGANKHYTDYGNNNYNFPITPRDHTPANSPNFSFSNITTSGVTVNIDQNSNPGYTEHRVRENLGSGWGTGRNWTPFSGSSNTYTISNADANQKLSFNVRARNEEGLTTPLNNDSIWTKPTNPTASESSQWRQTHSTSVNAEADTVHYKWSQDSNWSSNSFFAYDGTVNPGSTVSLSNTDGYYYLHLLSEGGSGKRNPGGTQTFGPYKIDNTPPTIQASLTSRS